MAWGPFVIWHLHQSESTQGIKNKLDSSERTDYLDLVYKVLGRLEEPKWYWNLEIHNSRM